MDETAYRSTRTAVAGPACVFARALLARRCDCALAQRHALAERETVGCRSAVARTNCATLLGMLRERSAFALKEGHGDAPLPHALAMRLQCGGLAGLAQAVGAGDARDVHALVAAAQSRYGELSGLPWPDVVAAVAAWQGRPRRGDDR
jgi:hypothetical protein